MRFFFTTNEIGKSTTAAIITHHMYKRGQFLHLRVRVRTLHKLQDLLVLFLGLSLLDEIDLVLQDQDVFELHDLDGGEMF